GESDLAGRIARPRDRVRPEVARLLQDAAGALEHGSAGIREADAAAMPVEQRDAELRLELSDLVGQRRLGDPQLGRGAGEAAQLGYPHEIAQLLQVHRSPPAAAEKAIEFPDGSPRNFELELPQAAFV